MHGREKGNILRSAKTKESGGSERMERWYEEVLFSVCFVSCSPTPRSLHHFVVNQPPVMTDTPAGHGSKLNWRSEVTLHGSLAPNLEAYLTMGSVCVLRGRNRFFLNFWLCMKHKEQANSIEVIKMSMLKCNDAQMENGKKRTHCFTSDNKQCINIQRKNYAVFGWSVFVFGWSMIGGRDGGGS